MINGQKEIWHSLIGEKKLIQKRTVIAISNCGRIMRHNGTIEFSNYNHIIKYNQKNVQIYRLIAEYFIPKTEEDIIKHRNCIDHITHNPIEMNINDVRNLRWCTIAENNNFDEYKLHQSVASKGRTHNPQTRELISENVKNKPKSLFGKKFIEHYGNISDNGKLYQKEYSWYRTHNHKCRWE